MAEAGLFDGERVELINGEVVRMSPQTTTHATVVVLVTRALSRLEAAGRVARAQLPMALGRSEPEPDYALVAGSPREFIAEHPSTALLIVEVAVSSLAYDKKKAGLYARAGVPEYWIVDVTRRQLLVHRQPVPMQGKPFKHGYREVLTESESGQVTPLIAPDVVIAVRDLLP
jgi:Uma2 family endonuclease